jgi:hypothetical protein
MLKRFLVVLMFVVPVPAWAACTQADLTGIWRFNFDTGASTGSARTYMMSCLLNIKAGGAIVPGACQTVNGSAEAGAFSINSPNRKLQMNNANCEARFSGNPQSGNDFELQFTASGGGAIFSINAARLSISADKQILLGSLGTTNKAYILTTAIKRATP